MRADLPNQPAGWNCVWDALAEVQTGHGELQTYISGIFDRLDGLADGRLGLKIAQDCPAGHAEQEALQEQIDRLASLTAELAQSVAEQKRVSRQEGSRRRT